MSFSFNFGGNDFDESDHEGIERGNGFGAAHEEAAGPEHANGARDEGLAHATQRHSLSDLIETLPPRISYSSLDVRIDEQAEESSKSSVRLYRRDLFDARFQLIQEDDDNGDEVAEDNSKVDKHASRQAHNGTTIDADSDLVPGEYEGGLKTWECALDLVGVLSRQAHSTTWQGKRVLELGCGTAIPSMYLLREMLLDQKTQGGLNASFDMCDYNEQVLRLVTLPNLFLTWYFALGEGAAQASKDETQASQTGELDLTPELLTQFTDALSTRGITLSLYSGPWQGLAEAGALSTNSSAPDSCGTTHDIILTSETIYSLDSLPALVDTLELAACGPGKPLESQLTVMNLGAKEGGELAELAAPSPAAATSSLAEAKSSQDHDATPLTLVAAKVLYFGVGGGVLAFEQELARRHRRHGPAQAKAVWKSERGVSRVVLQVVWQE